MSTRSIPNLPGAAAALIAFLAATGAAVPRPITVNGSTHGPGYRQVQRQDPETGDETRSVWREADLDPETAVALHEALDQLPPDLLEVVRLVYVEDLTQDEAAKRLGVNQATVSRRHAQALAKLREALDG